MNYVEAGLPVFLKADLWFLAFLAAFYGAGRVVAAPVVDRTRPAGAAMQLIFSLACGFFLCSVWVFLSAYFGFLTRPALLIFLAAGIAALGYRSGLPVVKTFRLSGFWQWAAFLVSLALAAVTFIASHAPDIGTDSAAYHLYFPRLYVETGRLVHDLSHPRSLWPSMMGMLFSAGLLLQGVALAKLFSWLVAMLAIFAPVFSAYYFSRNKVCFAAAWLLAVSVPAFWQQSFYAYTDHAMMLFAWLSFASFWIWREGGYCVRGAVITGMFTAALLSIKFYTLIVFSVIGAAMLFWICLDTRRRVHAYSAAVFVLTAAAFSCFWYVRNWVLTGNPVFPFAAGFFNGNGFSQRMVGFHVLGKGWAEFVLLPWNVATKPGVFGGEPAGVLFLMALPCLFLSKKRDASSNTALLIGVTQIVFWFYAIQHARFLFPALPFLIYGYASAIGDWMSTAGRFKKAMIALFGAVAAFQMAWGFYYPLKMVPAAAGLVDPEIFVAKNEHAFAVFREIAPELKKSDVMLAVGEPRLFYAPCRAVLYGPAGVWLRLRDGMDLRQWMKREGITHILSVVRDKEASLPDELRETLPSQAPLREGSVESEGGRFFYKFWKTS